MPDRHRHRHLLRPRTCRPAQCAGAVALLALAVLLAWAGPAAALVAVIEIAVPLESAEQLEQAVIIALQRATEGARAMGLPRVHVVSAQLTGQTVVLTVLAADQILAEDEPAGRGVLLPASLSRP
jgi:hypothetical protein